MGHHRLLVVEDCSWCRHPLQGIFGRLGWDVDLAGTVAEGLRLLDAAPEPCCLVLDLTLPDGPGEDVLRRVRERGYRTRVVVATGTTDPSRQTSAAELGPEAFLTKPIALADVWDGHCPVCEGD